MGQLLETNCLWRDVSLGREGMKKIADFEQQQESQGPTLSLSRHKLVAPINSAGGDKLLQAVSREGGMGSERGGERGWRGDLG